MKINVTLIRKLFHENIIFINPCIQYKFAILHQRKNIIDQKFCNLLSIKVGCHKCIHITFVMNSASVVFVLHMLKTITFDYTLNNYTNLFQVIHLELV